MKIILAQYFEIFQISSSGKIYNKNIMKLQEFVVNFARRWNLKNFEILR